MFRALMLEQVKDRWAGWNQHIMLNLGKKISILNQLQLEKVWIKVESVVEPNQQALVYLQQPKFS